MLGKRALGIFSVAVFCGGAYSVGPEKGGSDFKISEKYFLNWQTDPIFYPAFETGIEYEAFEDAIAYYREASAGRMVQPAIDSEYAAKLWSLAADFLDLKWLCDVKSKDSTEWINFLPKLR